MLQWLILKVTKGTGIGHQDERAVAGGEEKMHG